MLAPNRGQCKLIHLGDNSRSIRKNAKMNSFNIITVTRNNGLRAVRGATFKLVGKNDGRHFIKGKGGQNGDGMQIDAGLLTSPFALVSHHNRQKSSDFGSIYTHSEVTLHSVGIARDHDHHHVLVAPVASDLPHVPGLSGSCDPVLVWFPEEELRPVNTGITSREAHWVMPGLVRLLIMSDLWMEWRSPQNDGGAPVNIKIDAHGGECYLEERGTKVTSALTPYK